MELRVDPSLVTFDPWWLAVFALQLISFHKLRLMCAVGGVSVNRDLNQLMMGPPDILVATPGR